MGSGRWKRMLVGMAVGLCALAGTGASAEGAHVSCRSTITVDTTLDSDLHCPDAGLAIGMPNVTLDLNGHVIDGTRPPGQSNLSYGVVISFHPGTVIGFQNATIVNGTIRGFGDNVRLWGDGHRVSGLTLENPVFVNVLHFTGAGVDIVGNVLRGGSLSGHISLIDSNSAVVAGNHLSGGRGGIGVSGTGGLVQDNQVSGSGIGVGGGSGHRIRGNTVRTSFVSIGANRTSSPVIEHNAVYGGRMDVLDTSNAVIRDNALRGNSQQNVGIIVSQSVNSLIRGNLVSDFSDGLWVVGAAARGNIVQKNDLFSNGRDGLLVDADARDTFISKNRAVGNGDDGFDVRVAGTILERNRTDANGDLGIEAAPGVVDGGGNKARFNGNAAQCSGIVCK